MKTIRKITQILVFKSFLLFPIFAWGSTNFFKTQVSNSHPVVFEADDYRTNFETQITTGKGNVSVNFDNRQLRADFVELNNQNQKIRAEGRVQYQAGPLTATAEKMDIDLLTGFGTFYKGTIKVTDGMYIEGQKLEHYATDRFRVIYGKVSSCMDCPQAWSLTGSTIDVEIEGYAEAHHALFQIKDMPVAYFPVFYFPVKQRRQSGFLIPQIAQLPNLGLSAGQSYYWAINPQSDATFQYRFMTKGGHKFTNEYRIQNSDRTYFNVKTSGLRNQAVAEVPDYRFGYVFNQRWQISPSWTQRSRGEFAGDDLYSTHFSDEFENNSFSALNNQASVAWQNSNSQFFLEAKIYRSNLPLSKNNLPDSTKDNANIQRLPHMAYGIPSYGLWGPFRGTFKTEYSNFYRNGSSIDPNTGWIRTGQRGTASGRLSAPTSFSYFKYEPSVEFRSDIYRFDSEVQKTGAVRFRSFYDQLLEMDIWRVYDTDLAGIQKIRHSYNPTIRWSFSPPDAHTEHPFFDDNNSPKFDLFDPNSEITEYRLGTLSEEQRLRRHNLLTLGGETRLITRYGSPTNPSYARLLTLGVNRDYNLLTHEWSRLNLRLFIKYGAWRIKSSAAIDLDTQRIDTGNSVIYNASKFEIEANQRATQFSETYGGQVKLTAIGPWSFVHQVIYSTTLKHVLNQNHLVSYASPSKCWNFSLGVSRKINEKGPAIRPMFGINFAESADAITTI